MNRFQDAGRNAGKSIYELALGKEFGKLHPRVRERFSLHSGSAAAAVGSGCMDVVWHNRLAKLPLHIGTRRHILFPESGAAVPFTVENYSYKDRFGRETVTWIRTFRFPKRIRRFDATMVFSRSRGCIVDYLGNRQHLAVDLEIEPTAAGGIRLRSGAQRFYEGWAGFRFPDAFTGRADVEEWFDDEAGLFRIRVGVKSPLLGDVFRYEGRFENRMERAAAAVPPHALPIRTERRE
ncbi:MULTISPECIES: DUF4166 domain-containing protein [unclassified Paenibacillus]|uniref:DUF4166 domain-containing protein n=1 Tax=unclassified Paenibacillus TaxID=185978 RepID=UPI00095686AF|nr:MULTISPECIES: DUF4166 domain-containing protein [unclassified Paenibacillus]ASS65585.1 DUF4166 domain-containing protein [Paenibacillus sp. RUD330]SIQ30860.1 protein of unknown function [Paenibacillus sp. RU4X]SIQ52596.1 protein of unknown function [Paenibacillus sp. RU4T]